MTIDQQIAAARAAAIEAGQPWTAEWEAAARAHLVEQQPRQQQSAQERWLRNARAPFWARQ